MKNKVLVSWSGGKDSAYMLHKLLCDDKIEVVGLLCTITQPYNRVSLHGVRRELVELQSHELGLSLYIINIDAGCDSNDYQKQFIQQIKEFDLKFDFLAFGDIYLDNVRSFRENMFFNQDINLLFPLWGINNVKLSKHINEVGIKAKVICINSDNLEISNLGLNYDALLNKLPADVDCCGENGEFHTFVYSSPDFKKEISLQFGETHQSSSNYYLDIYN